MESPSLIVEKGKHHLAAEAYGEGWSSLGDRLLRFATGALRHLEPRHPQLDLDETPDSFKRDLGFLDGRAPHYEEDLMR
jgi:hypothetical protein